jgi:hypothetical protein
MIFLVRRKGPENKPVKPSTTVRILGGTVKPSNDK